MVAIVAVAAVLRFADLSHRGLVYWDEAKFSLEGERLHAYLQSWAGSSTPLQIGKTIGTAKPTHALLIALAFVIFGLHDYAPLFLNAFASVVEVILVYVLARKLFGPWAACIAALFFAVAEYEIIYARSALSESDAGALFLAAVLLWTIDWERMPSVLPAVRGFPSRMVLFAALLAGTAFTANYRIVVYIIALVAFDVVWTWNEHGGRVVLGRLVSWVGGAATVPVLWQIVDVIARGGGVVLFRSEVNVLVKSGGHVIFKNVRKGGAEWYLQQALFQLHGGKQSVFHFNPLIYLQWFVLREGWAIAALVVLGLVITIWTWLFPWAAMSALVFIPYAIYVFAPFIVPRNLDAAVPFAMILAAAALVMAAERIHRDVLRRTVVVVLALVIAGAGATLSWRLVGERSGFAQATTLLESRHVSRMLASNEVMLFYFPGKPTGVSCTTDPTPGSLSQLAADVAAGYRYAVLDHASTAPTRYIVRNARLIGHYRATGPISIGENPIASENGDSPSSSPVEYIDVYDLSTLTLPSPGHNRAAVCNRNVPI